ncbi:MAG: hypothetical protein V4864_07180 [Pseudomonadota bacterium]
MPRSPATAAPLARQPSATQPDAAPARLASPIDDSPRMLAQRRQIQSLFGPRAAGPPPPPAGGDVLQGYFVIGGQKTNDDELYADDADQDTKEAQIWPTVRAAVETAWKALPNHHFSDAVLDAFRAKLLAIAFAGGKKPRTVADEAQILELTVVHRAQAQVALADTASPAGVGGTLAQTPTLGAREKHAEATYRRTLSGGAGNADEMFDSDAYTKGPSRRKRDDEPVTTPKSGAQAWTKQQIRESIGRWTCTGPLARHLAATVWPLLPNTATGRAWEVKFREMDRLIALRDAEAQSRSFVIRQKSTGSTVKTLARGDFTVRARTALKAAILGGKRHPAEQQGVLFYDTLLKAEVDPTWQNTESDTFSLDKDGDYTVPGSLSMILTHWRPILLFDWILAEDVLNNSAEG